MSERCELCHSLPAGIRIRVIGGEPNVFVRNICLMCALNIAREDNAPSILREKLFEFARESGGAPEPNVDRLVEFVLTGDKETCNALISQLKSAAAEPPRPLVCPHCGYEVEKRVNGDGKQRKCGHCLGILRGDFARFYLRMGFNHGSMDYYDGDGRLPVYFGRTHLEESALFEKSILNYETALAMGAVGKVELLRDEINALRRNFTEGMMHDAKPARNSVSSAVKYISKSNRHVPWSQNSAALLQWIPFAEERPQVRLGSSVAVYRTIVDVPGMGEDATAEDYFERLNGILAKDPLFRNGSRNLNDHTLSSENGSVYVECDNWGGSPHRSFSFVAHFGGPPGSNKENLKQAREFLARLEKRVAFFVDPSFGYFHPATFVGGDGIIPMEFLHLPLLSRAASNEELRRTIQAFDGEAIMESTSTFTINPAPGLWQVNPSTCQFIELDDLHFFEADTAGRVKELDRIASCMEKCELFLRDRVRGSEVVRNDLENSFIRAKLLICKLRKINQHEATQLISDLWLGQELGCFPKMSKDKLLKLATLGLMPDEFFDDVRKYSEPFIEPLTAKGIKGAPAGAEWSDSMELPWEEQDLDVETRVASPADHAYSPGDSEEGAFADGKGEPPDGHMLAAILRSMNDTSRARMMKGYANEIGGLNDEGAGDDGE